MIIQSVSRNLKVGIFGVCIDPISELNRVRKVTSPSDPERFCHCTLAHPKFLFILNFHSNVMQQHASQQF